VNEVFELKPYYAAKLRSSGVSPEEREGNVLVIQAVATVKLTDG